MVLRFLTEKLAGGSRPPEDAVLIIAPDDASLDGVAPLIHVLTDGHVRISVVVLVENTKDIRTLRARFPVAIVRNLRALSSVFARFTLAALRVRAALVLNRDQFGHRARWVQDASSHSGIPVYRLTSSLVSQETIPKEAFICLSPASHLNEQPNTIDALASLLVRAVGLEREPRWSLDTFATRLLPIFHKPLFRRLLSPLVNRIDTIEALRTHLGRPQIILCLGNGPTSGNVTLKTLPRDALFRVNHQWKSNGFLTEVSMVFAGVKRSMRKLGTTPIGVATSRKEAALIAARVFEPWHGKATYTVVDEIVSTTDFAAKNSLRPTTGAYMLATALALEPERIIVAGMDMFSHTDGAYVEELAALNAYTPSHDHDTDAAFICAHLAAYKGELISYSPAFSILAKALEPSSPFTLVEPSSR